MNINISKSHLMQNNKQTDEQKHNKLNNYNIN